MTTTDKPPFDPVAAAAECMEWPIIAEAVRNYHNNDGFAETVFKLIHDDYRLGEAAQIVDVLLKRGKYAEDTPAAPVIPQPLAEIDALKERIAELEAENARLKAALKPFVDAAQYLDGTDGDSEIFWVFHTNAASGVKLGLFCGDLRRAESAVKACAA